MALLCPIAPSRGGLTSELECLGSSYTHIQQQQQQMGLTTLEQQHYDMDPFRQGLTPPQMPGDHMHPYGKDLSAVSQRWRMFNILCLVKLRKKDLRVYNFKYTIEVFCFFLMDTS